MIFCSVFLIRCDNKQKLEIAAEWNDIKITLSDFERSYFSYWQTTHQPDSPELRIWYVHRMIEQELIADSAVMKGLINKSSVETALKRETDYYIRRRYLEKTVKDTITPVTEVELNEALRRNQIRLRVRQLFAPDEEGIYALKQRLENGESFEQIARKTIPDSVIASRAGDLGWIGIGDTDLPVENVLFKMTDGEISNPVESLMGWHIFRIDSIEYTYDFQTSDDPITRKEAAQKLFNRKLEIAAAYHYRALVWSKQLAVRASLFKPVWSIIEPELPGSAKEKALFSYSGIEKKIPGDLGSEVIAEYDGKPLTVKEFIQSIPDLPRDLLRQNLKKAIEITVRDRIIKEEAIKLGLNQDPVVREKVNRSKINFQYYEALSIADSIRQHKVNLREYFDKHKSDFIDFTESEISEILVKDPKMAIEIAKRIQKGESFKKLAEIYSLREETRLTAGYLGWVSDKSGPIGTRAAKLKPGNLFAPVKTKDGFSVIRVEDRRQHYLDFEKAKQQVAQAAQRNYYEALHQSLLPKRYQLSDVIVFPDILNRALTDSSDTIF